MLCVQNTTSSSSYAEYEKERNKQREKNYNDIFNKDIKNISHEEKLTGFLLFII